jgi:hypothetical protein
MREDRDQDGYYRMGRIFCTGKEEHEKKLKWMSWG